MLSFMLDILGAYFANRITRRIPYLLFIAAFIGGISAIACNLLIYSTSSGSITPKDILNRIIFGAVIHPIISIIAALFYRLTFRGPSHPSTSIELKRRRNIFSVNSVRLIEEC